VNRGVYGDPIMKTFIDVATETVFGALWTRPGLDLKTRTLVCVVTDAATGRYPELAIHLRWPSARAGPNRSWLRCSCSSRFPGCELLDRPFNMRRPAVHIHGHLESRTPGAAPSPECWDG
jgi:Carboxymuconolactone decarboxylase family